MRICLVSPYDLSRPGGVNKHVLRLADGLRALGDEVDVIGPLDGPLPELRDQRSLTCFGGVVSIQGNASDNRIGLFTSPLAVRAFFRDRSYDVLHIHEPLLPALPYYAAWSANARARVATFHCYSEYESFPSRAARRLMAFHLRSFQRGIAVSHSAAYYAHVAWPEPMAIIPNGVETSFFDIPPAVQSSPTRLLFVGQWSDARKGLPFLLEAVAELRRGGHAVVLDVVGEGDGRPSPALVDGVAFHGRLSEAQLRRRFELCDALVAPSTGSESFGMVLIEAMAASRPVVCSDIDGYRQVVIDEGALLVPPRDAAALTSALASLCSDEPRRRRMGHANRAAALKLDWNQIAPSVRLEYEHALGMRDAVPGAKLSRDARTRARVSRLNAARR